MAAAILLKEPITLGQGVGIFLVLAGVQLAKVKKKEVKEKVVLSEDVIMEVKA